MIRDRGYKIGDKFTRSDVVDWFAKHNYSDVKKATIDAHLIRQSINAPSRIHHPVAKDGSDDLFYKIDSKHFRLYDPQKDPAPITTESNDRDYAAAIEAEEIIEAADEMREQIGSSEFAYEHDLRDYLAKNIHVINPELRLYDEDGIKGIEFPAGGRYIDILAKDNSGYVVIELKVSRGYDRVIGQLLRYINWIQRIQEKVFVG